MLSSGTTKIYGLCGPVQAVKQVLDEVKQATSDLRIQQYDITYYVPSNLVPPFIHAAKQLTLLATGHLCFKVYTHYTLLMLIHLFFHRFQDRSQSRTLHTALSWQLKWLAGS